MELNSDFRELLSALSSERVRYLVVGGYAVMHHSEPRYTKDLDVWVEPSRANAERVFQALKRFGAPLRGIKPGDFENERLVYQMGVEPVRIDILMGIPAVSFAEAWRERERVRWSGVSVNVLSRAHLVANKKRVARPQDLVDVQVLSRTGRPTRR